LFLDFLRIYVSSSKCDGEFSTRKRKDSQRIKQVFFATCSLEKSIINLIRILRYIHTKKFVKSFEKQEFCHKSKLYNHILGTRNCPRIRDVEAFDTNNKTEIKIIYFVPLRLIVWCTLILNFVRFKTKKQPHFFLRLEANIFWSYVITQGICNKFIGMKISVGVCFGCDCVCCKIEHLSNIDD
jgi:hypothetical protein